MPLVDLLEGENTRPIIPGINQLIHICPAYEIDKEPSPIAPDYVKLDHAAQDYTFIGDSSKGYFRRFQFKPKSGSTDEEKLGDVGTDGFKNKVIGTLYGGREETTKLINNIRNIGLIIIVKDNNGVQAVTGSKGIPAYLTVAKRASQNQVGDTPGPQWQVEFECDAVDPAYIYEGTPNTTPNP